MNSGRQVSDLYKQLGATEIELVQAEKGNIAAYEALGLDEIVLSPKCYSVDDGIELIREFAKEFIVS